MAVEITLYLYGVLSHVVVTLLVHFALLLRIIILHPCHSLLAQLA